MAKRLSGKDTAIWYIQYHKRGNLTTTEATMVKAKSRDAAKKRFKELYPNQTLSHIGQHSILRGRT